jgi:hypothetical protein
MKRLDLVDNRQHPRDKFITFEVAQLSEVRGVGSQMVVAIGVAAWAPQWAFTG